MLHNGKYLCFLRLLYNEFLGGATILTEDQIRKANGYSNDFWGWGGEDDDFYKRCQTKKLYIYIYIYINFRVTSVGLQFWRPDKDIARYRTFEHKEDKGNKANPYVLLF